MSEYKDMYYCLFNHVTDAIRLLEDDGSKNDTVALLKTAQLQTETQYIENTH